MNFRHSARAAFLIALLVCFATTAAHALYTVTDLGVLNDLAGQTKATINGVNNGGKAVGVSATNGGYLSFIYGGARTNLGTLGGAAGFDTNCFALGISISNVVCGSSLNTNNYNRAFRWTPGATNGVPGNLPMADLGALTGLGLNHSEANDINANGQITGESYNDSGSAVRAVRFNTSGTITDVGTLTPPQLPISFGLGISPSGQVVGSAYDVNYSLPEAFFYNGTSVTMLGDFNGVIGGGGTSPPYNSEAFGISGSGQVCGYALYDVNHFGESHAFRWIQGGAGGVPANPQMVDLSTLGGLQSSAWGINASNVIVGESTLAGESATNAFIATNNVMLNLNGLLDASSNNWVLIKAEYINDAETICGFGTFGGGLHGFLLTPAYAPVITNQPSPASVVVSNNATFTVVAGGNPSPAYQWRLNGTNISYGTTASLTITNCQATNAGNYTVVLTNYSGSLTSSPAALTVNFPPSISAPPSPLSVVVSNNATFTVTASGTATLVYQWRQNGTNLYCATGASLIITNCQATNVGNYTVVITNYSGSVTSSPAALTVNFPPSISAPPSPLSVVVSSNATFTVTASGNATLIYQWRQNGTNLYCATGSSLAITNCQATNAGNYTVVITNNYGSITSSPATLTVNFPPYLTAPPASQSVLIGSNATFAVACGGTVPLAYQWKFNAAPVGGTNTAFTITSAQLASAGNYSVIVTNSFGSATSAPAVLTVVTAPLLTSLSVLNLDVVLGFSTSTGATYFVESRTDLAAGNWLNTLTNIAGVGGTKTVTHTNGAGLPERLYRVRVTVP